MHEIAIVILIANIFLVLSTRSFTKIRHRIEIDNDWTTSIKPPVQILKNTSNVVFFSKLDINITNHVIGEIITDIQALDISILVELLKEVLVEVLKVVLDLARVERLRLGLRIDARSEHIRALVHVGENKGRADARLCVKLRASITTSTGSDLEVERTVYFLGLSLQYHKKFDDVIQ